MAIGELPKSIEIRRAFTTRDTPTGDTWYEAADGSIWRPVEDPVGQTGVEYGWREGNQIRPTR